MIIDSAHAGNGAAHKHICIDQDTTILAASRLMRCFQVDKVLVTDLREDKLLPTGIVSAGDIVTRIMATGLDPAVLTAGDLVWSETADLDAANDVCEMLESLRATGSDPLPVIDRQGGVAGAILPSDLLLALAETQMR